MVEELTRVGVVGLGYVGLPLALAMHDAGYNVVGVDIDDETIKQLQNGISTVSDVTDSSVADAVIEDLQFTTDYTALSDADGICICVPTPLRKTDTPDLSLVIEASKQLAGVLPTGCTVVLESTVYPGATREVVSDVFTENNKVIGEDIFIGFSPERIDPGNEVYGPTEIPKVLGGVTDTCGDRVEALYDPVFDEIVRVESAIEAELVKLLENTFRAVNIGLINELAQVAYELNINIWNVIRAAETKPFGYMSFYPGPGLGGHCIPVDPLYLSWKANRYGIDTQFINLADKINRKMPDHVVHRVIKQLNDRGVPLSEAELLVVGAAYKPNVSDTRESPAVDIIKQLTARHADVSYHDPHVPTLDIRGQTWESVPMSYGHLASADCVIIVTNHDTIDIERIVSASSLIFDTRNATADIEASNIVLL